MSHFPIPCKSSKLTSDGVTNPEGSVPSSRKIGIYSISVVLLGRDMYSIRSCKVIQLRICISSCSRETRVLPVFIYVPCFIATNFIDLNRSSAFCTPPSAFLFIAAVVFFLRFLLILQPSFLHSFMASTPCARRSFNILYYFFSFLFYFLSLLSSAVPVSWMAIPVIRFLYEKTEFSLVTFARFLVIILYVIFRLAIYIYIEYIYRYTVFETKSFVYFICDKIKYLCDIKYFC